MKMFIELSRLETALQEARKQLDAAAEIIDVMSVNSDDSGFGSTFKKKVYTARSEIVLIVEQLGVIANALHVLEYGTNRRTGGP